jgi:tRNA dimethylallyltransferase
VNPFHQYDLQEYDLIVILGPTASGKTALAVDLAHTLDAEIISADSRQVYRGMDIGTGKDLDEYQNIPYHVINNKSAGEKYNLADFQKDFWDAYNSIKLKGKQVILCGGTGLYIDAVLHNYTRMQVPENPNLRSKLDVLSDEALQQLSQTYKLQANTDSSTRKRTIRAIEIAEYTQTQELQKSLFPSLNPFVIGLDPPVEIRRENILLRLRKRLRTGLIEEVQELLHSGIPPETLIYYGLEYKFVMQYIQGLMSIHELEEKLGIAIQQYAKRQMTYFRSMERKGLYIHWLHF